MKTLITIWITGLPPSVNHLYNRGMKRVYINPEARAWREYAATVMNFYRNKQATPTRSPVSVTIRFITPNNRRWDIDNRLKALLDCLAKAEIIFDDSQIHALKMRREIKKNADPQTYIEVKEL